MSDFTLSDLEYGDKVYLHNEVDPFRVHQDDGYNVTIQDARYVNPPERTLWDMEKVRLVKRDDEIIYNDNPK